MSSYHPATSVRWPLVASILALAVATPLSLAQAPGTGRGGAPRPAFIPEGYDDHQNMMDQLGIKTLRPGESGQNQERFTEEKANPYKDTLPDVLKMKDGTKVTTAAQWTKRRAEIQEDFEREVYGRIPANVPKVTWEVTATTEGISGGIPIITKTLAGHVDNSAFPQITVNIQASFTVPANATGPVPIMIEFSAGIGGFGARGGAGRGAPGAAPAGPAPGAVPPARGPGATGPQFFDQVLVAAVTPAAPTPAAPGGPGGGRGGLAGPGGARGGRGGGAPPWQQQAIAHGWGYGNISTASIQADAGGNAMRQGIIGLINKGEPRKPEDWGALRAWQWGVSRLIDYFEATPDAKVDAKKVGVEGVSRYGKASLVTEAFEPRVAVAFVASSGEGGAKLHRHIFGESVENLTAGEYYWMGGNFMKYGASDATSGVKTAADIPVDSHELIALCAPRPVLVSYGVIAAGDPQWVDAHGSFMAAVLAGPVYKLLGKADLGTPGDYLTDQMPAVNQLIGGDLAWRQHSGGHDATPNWPTFFEWISKYVPAPALPAATK